LIEPLGGWSIEWKTFVYILSHLPFGSTILELGSGRGSEELSRYYDLHSVEHAEHYKGMYPTKYIFAPTKDKPVTCESWYDVDILALEMPKYELLLIDGPDHSTRKNILKYSHIFDWSKMVIVDDVQEADLMELGEKIAHTLCNRPFQVIDCEVKRFMVIP
jgi:hypothetical protein